MSSGVIDSFFPGLNDILGLRDDIGAALKPVYILTRTWSGSEPGDGTATDVKVRMLPSPRVVYPNRKHVNKPGGAAEEVDLMLKMVSKETYNTYAKVDDATTLKKIEKFYDVGGLLYRPIEIREKHLVYEILLRLSTDQTRY